MKNNIISGLALLCFTIGCAKQTNDSSLLLYDKVKHTNKSTKSILFFTSDYCIPCAKMKQYVWPNSKVERVVNTYHNSPWIFNGSEPDDTAYFHKYNIEFVPTTMIVDYNKKEIKRYVGYMSVTELLMFLDLKK